MTAEQPLYLALVWHMHQPYYKDVRTGRYIMPWVRLHATKDYLDMVRLLDEFPGIRMTVNMVPSLLEQIDDYVHHGATDIAWDLSVLHPSQFTDADKCAILDKFFHAHFDNMIRPYPRYRELFERRGWARTEQELLRAAERFTESAIRDLQVWYNLVWIDPLFRESDPELRRLVAKGRGFDDADKAKVLACHRELMAGIVPACRDAQARGQVELSTTAFYHPILPLVCDTDLARVARPQIALPKKRFHHPEDAREQVRLAVEYHEKVFGTRPRGMWPAEGSVAPEILPIYAAEGVQWIASDEEVLGHSTGQLVRRDICGNVLNPESTYQAYRAEHEGTSVSALFRDRHLSDLIGFQYAAWPPDEAAADLVSRLEHIARIPGRAGKPWVVPVILDGENCWEHYKDDGLPFLRALYGRLSESRLVETTTVSGYLDRFPPERTLPRLFAGSWINHDFAIWIGHDEDNQSWDYLGEVRELVERHIEANRDSLSRKQIDAAWKAIYIAEGSDWNWWYGDDHTSGIDEEYDQLYRDHLAAACQSVGIPPPPFLQVPIARKGVRPHGTEPQAFITPVIDGRATSFYEWAAAGHYDPALAGSSMHQAQYLLHRVFYGFDRENLYFRIDADSSVTSPDTETRVELNLNLVASETWKLKLDLAREGNGNGGADSPGNGNGNNRFAAAVWQQGPGGAQPAGSIDTIAVGDVVELQVAHELVNARPGDELMFYVSLEIDGREVERCPARHQLRLTVPDPDFETRLWMA
jgi:alpha-amylase/alpha-mannosidase (GH57 family)